MTEDQGGIDWDAAEAAAEREAIEGEDDDVEMPPIPDTVKPTTAAEVVAPAPLTNVAPAHKTRLQTFGDMLAKALPRVRAVIPKEVNPERLFAVAYTAMERSPGLLECSGISVLRGVIIGAQLGLDVSGIGGMAYLVPYGKTAQFIIGYRGMIELARRSKDIAWVFAKPVYRNEQFNYEVNPVPRIYHKPLPMFEEDRGEFVGAYAVAVYRDPGVPPQPEVMTKKEIDAIRQRSAARSSGPWVTDYEAMACKTVIRRLCKMLPQSPELARALDLEDRIESGAEITLPGELVEEVAEPEAPAATRTEEVKRKVGRPRKTAP